MRGQFITFEGGEGAGKSTQIALLAAYLQKKGIAYTITREPGGGKISEQIRSILLHNTENACVDSCEALLIAAARVQHVQDIILPSLQAGKIVLCDRYIHSTFAYQGYARGLDMQFLKAINAPATDLAMPDCTIFLDIAPQAAFARKDKHIQFDRIERAGLEFHTKVYNGFLQLAKSDKNIQTIDATLPQNIIHEKIINCLQL